jgi:chemotaxis protein MotB
MARKRRKRHEDHENHEAWAIPYGDLVTLLLAFFVVLYAISSVNDGKYRVLSNTLFTEFSGGQRTLAPIQMGDPQTGTGQELRPTLIMEDAFPGRPQSRLQPVATVEKPATPALTQQETEAAARAAAAGRALDQVAAKLSDSMADLIRGNVLSVKRKNNLIEIELRTDILYPSGSAILSRGAVGVIQQLAVTLAPLPNPIRVEGHTDSRPIDTPAFPSNWELSSARAASVVHLLASSGVEPSRLSVIGRAEFSPVQSNATAEGRNANRRVLIVILSPDGSPVAPATAPAVAAEGKVAQLGGTVPAQ